MDAMRYTKEEEAVDAIVERAYQAIKGMPHPGKCLRTTAAVAVFGTIDQGIPLRYLELTRRTYNALERAGITSTGHICLHTEEEILFVPGIGSRCLTNLIEALHVVGLKLRDEPLIEAEPGPEPEPGSISASLRAVRLMYRNVVDPGKLPASEQQSEVKQ